MKIKFNSNILPFLLAGSISLSCNSCGSREKFQEDISDPVSVVEAIPPEEEIEEVEEYQNVEEEEEDSHELETSLYVVSDTSLNVRRDTSIHSSIIGGLTPGSKLLLLDHLDGWYKVDYYGVDAYVSDEYSHEESVFVEKPLKIICFLNGTTLTTTDSEEKIEPYEIAFVYDETSSSYYVSCNNKLGYVPSCDSMELDGYYAIVDKSDQRVDVYHDNELLFSSPCVTGRDSSPTTSGLHEIWCVRHNCYLTGPGYRSYVNDFLAFHGGQGFHDASWRGVFGTNQYHSHGSHGCVNLPMDVGKKISQTLVEGDKVLVKK